MKNGLISFLMIFLAAYIAGVYLPWYAFIFSSFVIGFFYTKGHFNALLAGFLAVFVLYCLQAWWIDKQSEGVLSRKIAEVFGVSDGIVLAVIGGILGGILSGLAAGTGTSLRDAMKGKVVLPFMKP